MNELYIVGKALGDLEVKTSEGGTTYAQMLLSVKRPFKSKDGNIESDIIQITMFKGLIDEAKEVVSDGKPLIVKGHISSSNYVKEGKTIYNASVIADRVSEFDQLF